MPSQTDVPRRPGNPSHPGLPDYDESYSVPSQVGTPRRPGNPTHPSLPSYDESYSVPEQTKVPKRPGNPQHPSLPDYTDETYDAPALVETPESVGARPMQPALPDWGKKYAGGYVGLFGDATGFIKHGGEPTGIPSFW